jgi:hypothetical protein
MWWIGGEGAVRSPQVVADLRMALREALHVRLVDDRVVPRDLRRPVVLPVEGRIDDDALGDGLGVVLVVELEVGVFRGARYVRQDVGAIPLDRPLDRLRVRVDEELARIEAMPGGGVVRTVDAVPVSPTRLDAGEVAMPVVRGHRAQLHLRLAVAVEEAQHDALGVLGEDGEVRPFAVPRRPEREGVTRPDRHPVENSTCRLPKSATSVAPPRRSRSTFASSSASASSSRGSSRRSASSAR